VESQQRIKL